MFGYNQTNGILSRSGAVIGTGYSGHGEGVNNPAMEKIPNVGPIPRGMWNIGPAATRPDFGSVVMSLTPQEGTDTFGRGGFLMHGDEVAHPGEELASHGCIILPKSIRQFISDSGDTQLEVV